MTTTLNAFRGIQIDLGQLNGITIAADGQSALFQGGAHAEEVKQTLWDQGYITGTYFLLPAPKRCFLHPKLYPNPRSLTRLSATGSNECVGLAGPALGGGHGRLEGLYGLVSDNFIHLNVVLGDGSEIGVNATSHEDLFWAMQGAGHNFGIVTSMQLKIYPAQSPTWHYHNYYWTQDKLETVFEEWNNLLNNGNGPVLMGSSYGQIHFVPELSENEVCIPRRP